MTAKEKAKELYCKYADALNVRDMQITANPYVKQCALIAVDEILELRKGYFDCTNPMQDESYWNEVKQELTKL